MSMDIKKLTLEEFNAFFYVRDNSFRCIEIEWYSFLNGSLLGLIVKDLPDQDYSFGIMGRDKNRIFRCIDGFSQWFETLDAARSSLFNHIKTTYSNNNLKKIYPQGDERQTVNIDLFSENIKVAEENKYYKILKNDSGYLAARRIMNEIANMFEDVDGDFVKKFKKKQDFHHRLWEFYIFAYLKSMPGRNLIRVEKIPDFAIDFRGDRVFIELTTINHKKFNSDNLSRKELYKKYKNTLNKKFNKKYWQHEHVIGQPLVFAIHEYITNSNLGDSNFELIDWLYNHENEFEKKIDVFERKGGENISGILLSGQATINKFNRMGIIAGLDEGGFICLREKTIPYPNDRGRTTVVEDVRDPKYIELWSEGIILFHNPNALNPVPKNIFNDITQIFCIDGNVEIISRGNDVFKSETFYLQVEK